MLAERRVVNEMAKVLADQMARDVGWRITWRARHCSSRIVLALFSRGSRLDLAWFSLRSRWLSRGSREVLARFSRVMVPAGTFILKSYEGLRAIS